MNLVLQAGRIGKCRLFIPDVFVSGDEMRLGRLAGILLDNAVKYSEEGGAATLSLTARQENAVLSIYNAGAHL